MFPIVSEMEGKIKHPSFKVESKCSQMSPSVDGDSIMVSRNIMTDRGVQFLKNLYRCLSNVILFWSLFKFFCFLHGEA